MKRSMAIVLIISFFVGMNSPMGYAEGTNETSKKPSNEDKIIVLSQMELLAGILTQTTEKWDPTAPVVGYDNDYYNELKAFFKPYKNPTSNT